MAVVTRLELRAKNGTNQFDKYPIAVNIPISLNYNLADVRNPDQRKASFSKTINVPYVNSCPYLFCKLCVGCQHIADAQAADAVSFAHTFKNG